MTLTQDQDLALLRRTIEIAAQARADGNHPFGALLADEKGKILFEAGNAFSTQRGLGHAELIVARKVAVLFEPEELARCTLVTSFEPCAMCAGGIYWAGIGSLVYGMTETRLAELTGTNEENLTMDLPCRTVFEAGQRPIEVRGPYPELEDEIIKGHKGFW